MFTAPLIAWHGATATPFAARLRHPVIRALLARLTACYGETCVWGASWVTTVGKESARFCSNDSTVQVHGTASNATVSSGIPPDKVERLQDHRSGIEHQREPGGFEVARVRMEQGEMLGEDKEGTAECELNTGHQRSVARGEKGDGENEAGQCRAASCYCLIEEAY
jgi:hypothetical protein